MKQLDLIHKLLNIVAPLFTLFSFLLFLPPYIIKYFLSIFGTFVKEDVAGKVVIITGASSGIGEHLAYEYARRGACLTIASRREESLREVAERALNLGAPDVLVVPADVSNVEDCRSIVDRTMSHFGRIDHLVNNAGVVSNSMFEEIEEITHVRSIMDINFWGSVYMTKFAIPYLRNSEGRIIVLSSASSWMPTPRMSLYSASKAAMTLFFETLRIELGRDIKITLVTPGFVESEMTQGKYIDEKSGRLVVKPHLRDVHVGIAPVMKVEDCAKSIVDGSCRGKRYITVPGWFRVTYLWQVFCPEVVEWLLRLFYLTGPGTSPEDALNKKILDYTGLKVMYPKNIRKLEPKTK
ncbi:11-beta-hydroxysteroid dehydrogenase 1A [Capsicum annuum]|uniref:11-beta-hydroxysteroid dehydrogenase A n=1 Tax=Capsicum annuum TaxID=4072 RepID=UPI001FB0F153|nr:11-beta-hydroxysteroid dehydrogenase A [Capsicum annuum]XP_016564084.2 11-beta-hydroxysteroid dehydrogenase A [Capsicum annuum]KAF3655050.1 11-beta-hydroxysteroid dehydrogenase 1A [Capsicum annuum]